MSYTNEKSIINIKQLVDESMIKPNFESGRIELGEPLSNISILVR